MDDQNWFQLNDFLDSSTYFENPAYFYNPAFLDNGVCFGNPTYDEVNDEVIFNKIKDSWLEAAQFSFKVIRTHNKHINNNERGKYRDLIDKNLAYLKKLKRRGFKPTYQPNNFNKKLGIIKCVQKLFDNTHEKVTIFDLEIMQKDLNTIDVGALISFV
jgi:hypothetical protein